MKKIHECRLLHDGWEMDNELWVVEMPNGSREVRATCHGDECVINIDRLDAKTKETRTSLEGLIKAKELVF